MPEPIPSADTEVRRLEARRENWNLLTWTREDLQHISNRARTNGDTDIADIADQAADAITQGRHNTPA